MTRPDLKKARAFLEELERTKAEVRRLDELVLRYKKELPRIDPRWDDSSQSIEFNDVNNEIRANGFALYSVPMDEMFSGLFESKVWERHTLWSSKHSSSKIARVIEHWEKEEALSPIFLVKHGNRDLGLVRDGNHRLTVARALGAKSIPFLVERTNSEWVKSAFPSTKILGYF